MDLSDSKLSEQKTFIARPKIEEHMLISVDKSTHEQHLSRPLKNNKNIKIALTFLTTHNGIFNVTIKNNVFFFATSRNDNGFNQ